MLAIKKKPVGQRIRGTQYNGRVKSVIRNHNTIGTKFDSRTLTIDLLKEWEKKRKLAENNLRRVTQRQKFLTSRFGYSPNTPEMKKEYVRLKLESLKWKKEIKIIETHKKRLLRDLKHMK